MQKWTFDMELKKQTKPPHVCLQVAINLCTFLILDEVLFSTHQSKLHGNLNN